MEQFDVLQAAEEVARARWESRTAIAHRRAALLLRIIRHLGALGEAAVTVSMAADLAGYPDQGRAALLIVAAMASDVLAQVGSVLHLDRERMARLLDLCIRCGERRSIAYIHFREIGAAIRALAAEEER
ncbi:hypothetical protein HRbin24_00085 [bacterium HR24]|nr:hypothetical protein HRbin24_00085 [bacterium HR24]